MFNVVVMDVLHELWSFVDSWTVHLLLRVSFSDFIKRGVVHFRQKQGEQIL